MKNRMIGIVAAGIIFSGTALAGRSELGEIVALNRDLAEMTVNANRFTFGLLGLDRPTTLNNLAVYHSLVVSYIQLVDAHTRQAMIKDPEQVSRSLLRIVARAQAEIDEQFADLEEHKTALSMVGLNVDEWKSKASRQLALVSSLLWGRSSTMELLSGHFNPKTDMTSILESQRIMKLERDAIKRVYDEQYAFAVRDKENLRNIPRI